MVRIINHQDGKLTVDLKSTMFFHEMFLLAGKEDKKVELIRLVKEAHDDPNANIFLLSFLFHEFGVSIFYVDKEVI